MTQLLGLPKARLIQQQVAIASQLAEMKALQNLLMCIEDQQKQNSKGLSSSKPLKANSKTQ